MRNKNLTTAPWPFNCFMDHSSIVRTCGFLSYTFNFTLINICAKKELEIGINIVFTWNHFVTEDLNWKKYYLLIHSTACFFYMYLVINVSPKDTESVSLSLSLLSPLWNRGRVLGDRMSACTRESFGDVWISILSIRGSEILLKGKFPYTINCYWKWNFYVPIRSFLVYSLKSPDIVENN